MRNLKRALSLTLASVMLLGMMVIGTSAASFTDADQITNVTAATVLQELEVMQGSNGKFSPNQTVTRGQMAILICKMLYGSKLNAENFAGTSEFTDVPANAYYTGYVNLASQLGIISGYGNGKFGPGAPVTTAQAALMLTRALGYFQAGELEGQTWTSNAIAAVERATKINMFGSLKLGTNDPLSRDNVCEMVFNAMTKAVPVHYSERWGVYYTDSQSILNGVNFNYRDTLGYQNFDLVYNEDKDDDFNRPATEWGTGVINSIDDKGNIAKNGANIKVSFIKAVNTADATYSKEVKLSDIYKDLGLGEAVAASKVTFYRNGKGEEVSTGKITDNSSTAVNLDTLGLSKSTDNKIGANGVLTQVWYDADDKTAEISMIDTYVGKINSVNKSKGTVNIATFTSPAKVLPTLDNKFETEGFEINDIVTYTAAWSGSKYEIKTMEALGTPVTGTLTKWAGSNVIDLSKGQSDSNFTVDNDTYKYSYNNVIVKEDGSQQGSGIAGFSVNSSEINVYLDDYGYAIYVAGVEGETNYAAVIGVGNVNQYGDGANGATLLLADGTTKTVTFKMKSGQSVNDLIDVTAGVSSNEVHNNTTASSGWSADIVKYRVLDDGTYELDLVGAGDTTYDDAVGEIKFVNGKSEFILNDGADEDGNGNPIISGANDHTLYTTEKTVFFVATKDGSDGKIAYNVYTGYKAAPGIADDEANHCVAYVTNSYYGGQVDAVYLAYDKMDGVSAVDTYFVKKAKNDIVTTSEGRYYVLPAVVNGEVTTVKLDAGIDCGITGLSDNGGAKGVFAINNVIKDKNDIITNFSLIGTVAGDGTDGVYKYTGTVAPGSDRVVLGVGANGNKDNATFWAYNASTKVYRVNEDMDAISVIDVASVYTDKNDAVFIKVDDKTKVLVDVFVTDVKDSDSSDGVDVITIEGLTVDFTTGTLANPGTFSEIKYDTTKFDSAPTADDVNNQIIADMAKQGWEYIGDAVATDNTTDVMCFAMDGKLNKYVTKVDSAALTATPPVEVIEVTSDTAAKAAADGANGTDPVEIVVNKNVTIDTNLKANTTVRTAKGTTTTVTGSVDAATKLLGEGTVKIKGDASAADKDNIETPVVLSGASAKIGATNTPVTVEKNATATMSGNAAKPVTLETGSTLNLDGSMDKLPVVKGTGKIVVKTALSAPSGSTTEEKMLSVGDAIAKDAGPVTLPTAGSSKSVKVPLSPITINSDDDSGSTIETFGKVPNVDHQMYKLTVTGLTAGTYNIKVYMKPTAGAEWTQDAVVNANLTITADEDGIWNHIMQNNAVALKAEIKKGDGEASTIVWNIGG